MSHDLERFHAGDEALFRELHERCQGALKQFLSRIVSDRDDVEDLLQESWWLAYRRRRSLKDLEKFSAWITRIARNLALSYRRECAHNRCVRLPYAPLVDPAPTAEESSRLATAHQERLEEVTDMVVGLPPRERIVVLMYYYTQSSVNRIAEELGVAPGTVKATLFHAREHIRERYERLPGGAGRLSA